MLHPRRPWLRPKKKIQVRRVAHRTGWRQAVYGVFRFVVYGFLGVALEIFFYNLVKLFRDVPLARYLFQFHWRVDERLSLDHVWDVPLRSLYGQCSLWMFLVYGVACFAIEQLYLRIFAVHWAVRAASYGLVIFFWECASGWALKALTGYEIWFYDDAGNFFRMTSWFILPIWMITGLLVEYIFRQLMDPDAVELLEKMHLSPDFRPSAQPPPSS